MLADESWFDAQRTAPGWKAAFFINESPPLSALVVDRGRYDGHIARQPALAAAGQLRRLLLRRGITAGPVATGRAPAGAYGLAQIESEALPDVLKEMDRDSDNFTAELILKEIGAEAGDGGHDCRRHPRRAARPGGCRRPARRRPHVRRLGLSLDDRLTARALAALLVVAWNDVDLRNPFWAALPVAGVTARSRTGWSVRRARGAVRAKTGTTNRASALSGYVRDRYVFAVMQNGWPVSTWSARKAQDRFATTLASAL